MNATLLVDHHAHGILRAPPASLDEFRGLFSESSDPRQWPHIAHAVTYQRSLPLLAQQLDCEPTESAVYELRVATEPSHYAARLLRASGTELILVDDGFPPASVATRVEELGELAGSQTRPVMRIERVAEEAGPDGLDAVRSRVAAARADGYVALKTIAAYRGGLDLDALGVPSRTDRLEGGPSERPENAAPDRLEGGSSERPENAAPDRLEGAPLRALLLAALEANEATGDPLPVQVHTGFGDSDLSLPGARPALLKPLIERFAQTTFVLLHCYPFVREAGWLAHVYANVYFDLSLTIPHVSRPAVALAEALELAPTSKLLYASDAARTPELYLLASIWWRDALAEVLPELFPASQALASAQMILRENALALYRLG